MVPSFKNKDEFLGAVDALPPGVSWKLENVTVTGDVHDEDEQPLKEELELWYRDPVEVVRELLGNPIFRDVTCYAPEQIHRDGDLQERVVNEMWTGDWWWDMQVSPMWSHTIRNNLLTICTLC